MWKIFVEKKRMDSETYFNAASIVHILPSVYHHIGAAAVLLLWSGIDGRGRRLDVQLRASSATDKNEASVVYELINLVLFKKN